MARITKKQVIGTIFDYLKANPEKEICVAKYQNELRNGRWGFHAYCLCALNNIVDGWVLYARPWSGAHMCWRANLERLHLADLEEIAGRCK